MAVDDKSSRLSSDFLMGFSLAIEQQGAMRGPRGVSRRLVDRAL